MLIWPNESVVGNADHTPTWIAAWRAESEELFEKHIAQMGFLHQLAPSGGIQIFLNMHEASGQSPRPQKRFYSPPNEQDLKSIAIEAEYRAIDGKCWTRVFVGEWHTDLIVLF
jgi:hypothetical protein